MSLPPPRRIAFAVSLLLLATAMRAEAQQSTSEPADSAGGAPASPDSAGPARPRRIEGVRVVAPRERRDAYAVLATRTATKTPTPLRDTPQSATILTHAVIADQAMQSMADALRYVPGVTMAQGEGNRDAPVIRGQATTADFFVDGVRDDAQYLRDLYNVERIEALKGANAMIFGRGGGGGIINQVRKEASWTPVGTLTIEGGSFEHKRGTVDVGRPLGDRAAVRFDAMYERSSGFRDAARISRSGVTPTMTILAGSGTTLRVDYEHFHDDRSADRGIPSFRGAPSPAPITAFFGDPAVNVSRSDVDAGTILVDRVLGAGLTLRNRTRAARYDKFYRNVVPGAVDSTGTQVELRGYDNAHDRASVFNQTDLTGSLVTGAVKHTLLAGAELSRQSTDNVRQTGYFGDATTLTVPFATPDAPTGVQFRQSPTDADNDVRVDVGALYVQDQVALGPHWQAIAGVRVDAFTIRFHDHRDGGDLARYDRLVSPRAGLIFKPIAAASLYASYGVSHLPSSGDQFSSLTATTETLEPERFRNLEVGAKWDLHSALSLTGAVFQLDRNNSTAPDPLDPSRTVQTGAQRSTGYELGATGALTPSWQVVAGWSSQTARITSATRAGAEGATVPLVPRSTLSLWNRVQLAPSVGAGLGAVYQSSMYAALDNTVTLPSFTRYDAALFVGLPWHTRAQLNVENLLDTRYYATSQGNNNIMPGASRTLRISLGADF
ncbi:MAG TPA: TonB-dependent siderophore receptor [Gemmatimonadaceae bacterium]|jgi:catecholate siderophore receptor|nr:TonB-dependent siderophore receptor [Gemmatimonadaceae bacterium]